MFVLYKNFVLHNFLYKLPPFVSAFLIPGEGRKKGEIRKKKQVNF